MSRSESSKPRGNPTPRGRLCGAKDVAYLWPVAFIKSYSGIFSLSTVSGYPSPCTRQRSQGTRRCDPRICGLLSRDLRGHSFFRPPVALATRATCSALDQTMLRLRAESIRPRWRARNRETSGGSVSSRMAKVDSRGEGVIKFPRERTPFRTRDGAREARRRNISCNSLA